VKKNGYKIIPNQELLGIGMGNLIGSFFKSYPITGSFSRSVVAHIAGSRSPLFNVITSIVVVFTVLLLTHVLYYIPYCVLAAVIIVGAWQLFEYKILIELWYLSKRDLLCYVSAWMLVSFLGIETGLLLAIAISMVLILLRVAVPHTAILGKFPGSKDTYRSVKRFPGCITYEGLVIFRFDQALFFANKNSFRRQIRRIIKRNSNIKAILVDCCGISFLDSSGVLALREIKGLLKKDNVILLFASLIGPVRTLFKRSGLVGEFGREYFFWHIHEGVSYYKRVINPKLKKVADIENANYSALIFEKEEQKRKSLRRKEGEEATLIQTSTRDPLLVNQTETPPNEEDSDSQADTNQEESNVQVEKSPKDEESNAQTQTPPNKEESSIQAEPAFDDDSATETIELKSFSSKDLDQ